MDIDVRLPVINHALKVLNAFPIQAKQLKPERPFDEKMVKILLNLKQQLIGSCSNPLETQPDSIDFCMMVHSFKSKFHEQGTLKSQKYQLLTLLPPQWSVKKVSETMGAPESMVIKAKTLVKTNGILSCPDRRQGWLFYSMDLV